MIRSRKTTADRIRIRSSQFGFAGSGRQIPQFGTAAQHDSAAGRAEGRDIVHYRYQAERDQLVEHITIEPACRRARAESAQDLPLIGAELKVRLGQHGLLLQNNCTIE